MDKTERRLLDEYVARLGLPPGEEADAAVARTFAYRSEIFAIRLRELGKAVGLSMTRKAADR